MSDTTLRTAERDAATGDPAAEARLFVERWRAGAINPWWLRLAEVLWVVDQRGFHDLATALVLCPCAGHFQNAGEAASEKGLHYSVHEALTIAADQWAGFIATHPSFAKTRAQAMFVADNVEPGHFVTLDRTLPGMGTLRWVEHPRDRVYGVVPAIMPGRRALAIRQGVATARLSDVGRVRPWTQARDLSGTTDARRIFEELRRHPTLAAPPSPPRP